MSGAGLKKILIKYSDWCSFKEVSWDFKEHWWNFYRYSSGLKYLSATFDIWVNV